MRLEELLENRTPGKTATAHNWFSYCWRNEDDELILNVTHHFTQMIQFKIRNKKPHFPIPLRSVMHVDIGHGSKSDQKGMNRIFIALGLPWYYSRGDGVPKIVKLLDPKQQHLLPKYLQNRDVRTKVFGYVA